MDLYFEAYSGIAGDMTIGALLDLGADKEVLIEALKSMNFGEYKLVFERCKKKGIDAFNFDVITEENPHEHHHHHEHEHGHCHGEGHKHHHEHEHCHEHKHESEGCCCHEHVQEHEHHHVHRGLKEIIEIINSGNFSQRAKENAIKIFEIIGKAEAKAHGVDINEVHFHEVGGIDSIIDIVGVCVLLDNLNPEHIYFTDLYEGKGFVKCAHGMMPVPAPAVLNIATAERVPLKIIDDEGEHVTPTGIAIAALFSEGVPPYSFVVKRVGIGAGNKDFKNTTNILRVMEIENSKK